MEDGPVSSLPQSGQNFISMPASATGTCQSFRYSREAGTSLAGQYQEAKTGCPGFSINQFF
jgi:hypothetical protein